MLSLGEDAAKGLGLEVERSRFLCLLTVLLLAGGAVFLTGPVAFVGLLVPHVVPLFTGAGLSGGHSLFHGGGRFLYAHCRYYFPYHQCACRNAHWSDFSLIGVPFFHLDCKKGGTKALTDSRKNACLHRASPYWRRFLSWESGWISMQATDISARRRSGISYGEKGEKGVRFTLLQLRLPRVLASLLAGAGLSVSGCVIQGVSRNEMAEPGILGINAGAGLFVAAFIVFSQDRLKPSP